MAAPILKLYDLEATRDDQRTYWDDKMADIYFNQKEAFLRAMNHQSVVNLLRRMLIPTGRILDAGCGSHYLAALLAKPGRVFVGMDFAPGNLKRAKGHDPHLNLALGDLRCTPFASETMDAILSVSTAEHIEEGPEALLRESARMLKPKGQFLFLVPTYTLEDRLRALFRRHPEHEGLTPVPHLNARLGFKVVKAPCIEERSGFFGYWFPPSHIETYLERAGFALEQQIPLEIAGGLMRSVLFGRRTKELITHLNQQFFQTAKETHGARFRGLFQTLVEEDFDANSLIRSFMRLIGSAYRYNIAYICRKR